MTRVEDLPTICRKRDTVVTTGRAEGSKGADLVARAISEGCRLGDLT